MIKEAAPKISVVMSVYNGMPHLPLAVDSILTQTFKDYEFIIIDDGSTDETLTILKGYNDPRIRLVSRENKGLIKSLNEGINLAQGKYIARQDSDDISAPNRFEALFKFLSTHPKVDVVGCGFSMMDDNGTILHEFMSPGEIIDVGRSLFVRNPLAHGSVLVRKDALARVSCYKEGVGPIEDYDLWTRLYIAGSNLAILPDILYSWRHNLNGISSQNTVKQSILASKLKDSLWRDNVPTQIGIRQARKRYGAYRKISGVIARRFAEDQLDILQTAASNSKYKVTLRQSMACLAILPACLGILSRRILEHLSAYCDKLRGVVGAALRKLGWKSL